MGEAPSAPEVEGALGEDRSLTVLNADRGEDTARTVHHALRLMLGDLDFVRLVEPHAVDLTEVLTLAHRRGGGPVVLLVDDAPPALLDQLDIDTLALLHAQVRLVVITRPSFLDTLSPAAVGVLFERAAGAEVPSGVSPEPTPPTQALDRAVLDTVVDWDRLGLGPALTSTMLEHLVVAQLPVGSTAPDVPGLRRAVRRCLGGGHLRHTRRRGERHLAPSRAWVMATDGDGPLARPLSPRFAEMLRRHLGDADRVLAGRVAVARGEREVALYLLGNLDPGLVPPLIAEVIGMEFADRATDHDNGGPWPDNAAGSPIVLRADAVRWLRSAAERGDATLAPHATRLAGIVAYRGYDWAGARELLADASADETDREVQWILGRMDLAVRGDVPSHRAEGRRRLELVLAGGDEDDQAARAASLLADLALEDGRDDDAVPLLAIAARTTDPAAAHAVRLRRVQLLRRLGRHDEEEAAITEMLGLQRDSDPVERRQEVALEAATVRRRKDDLDGATRLLQEAAAGGGALGVRAAIELGELEVSRERWQDALAAFPETVPEPPVGQLSKELRARRNAGLGEAAFQLEKFEVAKRAFEKLRKDPHALLRLGEISLAQGRVLDAYRYFVEAEKRGAGSEVAERARELAQSVRPQAERVYAQQQAESARQAALRAEAADLRPA